MALISQENLSLRFLMTGRKVASMYVVMLALPMIVPYLLAFAASQRITSADLKQRIACYAVLIVSTMFLTGILLTQHPHLGSVLFLGFIEVLVCTLTAAAIARV